MLKTNKLSKLGIGTWGIGGFAKRNPNNDDKKQVNAISYMFSQGINYIELNVWTSEGHGVELASQALSQSGVERENIFLSQAIYSYTAPTLEAAKSELTSLMKLFKTNYMDSLSLNEAAISAIGKDVVLTWYHKLLDQGIIRFVNLNNPSLITLKEAKKEFGNTLFSIEIGFNFEIRENDENGIIDFAHKNNVKCVIYQPLRRNRTSLRNWPLLIELSKKYGKTQNQILLNWISSRGYLPLTKSEEKAHIDEHIAALNFTITAQDLMRLNEFRPPHYHKPQVYWGTTGEGVRIDQLSNIFDEDYDKQTKH